MKSKTRAHLEKHLARFLGRPRRVSSLKKGPAAPSKISELAIAQFAPGGPRKPVVFATVGGFEHRMKDGRRIEAMMLFKSEPRASAAVREILATIVLTPEALGRALRHGDVVNAGSQLALLGATSSALLLLPPMTFAQPLHRAPLADGTAVEWMWAVPVFAEEAAYAKAHGATALVKLCAAQKIDLSDLRRRPADVTVAPEEAERSALRATVERMAPLAKIVAKPRVRIPRPETPRRHEAVRLAPPPQMTRRRVSW